MAILFKLIYRCNVIINGYITQTENQLKKPILNDRLVQMDLTHRYRTSLPKATENAFFSSKCGTFSRWDHMLGCKMSLNNFKKIEVISSISSNHNSMKHRIIRISISSIPVINLKKMFLRKKNDKYPKMLIAALFILKSNWEWSNLQ